MQKADIIATVLFGDGAAAACLSSDRPANVSHPASFGEGHEEIWPDTLQIMGWDVDETGFGVVFDRSIPTFAAENLADVAGKALARANMCRDQVSRFVCHPGGAKVVESIESALQLSDGSLDIERSVLRDYGNMSAPTVLFVLKRVLERKLVGNMMMSALGPGFTASFLPLLIGPKNA
jgi:alkylresorcinol/alkylpyrone synthase